MNTAEALAFIQSVGWRGSRLGLSRMRTLLDRLGNPQSRLKFIHIAGTNGKGSTAAMLSAILREAGYVTGLYTSPHLSAYNERIQINGTAISDPDFSAAAEQVRRRGEAMEDPPTEFEVITAMALWHFAEKRCDVVILETGLGGRLDATNVIPAPEAAVITNIGLEHTEILGDTLEKIAREKAGIIKPGCPVICYESAPEALAVIQETCAQKGVPCIPAARSHLRQGVKSLEGQTFFWKDQGPYVLALLGDHQVYNAAAALETVAALRERGWSLPEDAVRRGLNAARWPARFELLKRDPLVIIDGAHNPQCAQALAGSLTSYLPGRKFLLILGVLEDKDVSSMLRTLLPLAWEVLCVTPDSPRALSAEQLAERISGLGGTASACLSMEDAVRRSLEQREHPIVACGSLYMAGAIRALFLS